MSIGSTRQPFAGIRLSAHRCTLALGAFACCVGIAGAAPALAAANAPAPAVATTAASGTTAGPAAPTAGSATATLEQCTAAAGQAERSATFLGEMTAVPGTGHMTIRIELQERLPQEGAFRNVAAPGLGVWRAAAPGVKVYRYIKQVTNLSAPAFYRAAVRFRWLNAKGKLIRGVERRSPVCAEPGSAASVTSPSIGA
jgi:hypothetical protein